MSSSSSNAADAVGPSSSALAKLNEKVKQKLDQNASGSAKKKNEKSQSKGSHSGKKDKKDKKDKRSTPKGKENSKEASESTGLHSKEDLLREITALGGTKDDLDLIDNLDSGDESEIELGGGSDGKLDKNLDQDVSKFMDGLGIENDGHEPQQKKSSKKSNKDDEKTDRKDKKKDRKEKPQKQQKVEEEAPVDVESYSHSGKLLLEPRADWYNPDLAPVTTTETTQAPLAIQKLHETAKDLLKKENDIYSQVEAKSSSQKKFLGQMLTSGTLSDKISALTLMIQESPLHSMRYFDQLLYLCKKKSKTSALQGIAALKDLFIGGVLPDRKLKWFKNQPISRSTPTEWLIVWAFEDWLKDFFFNLLHILETLSHDSVQYIRRNTTNYIVDLLKAKPEQEVNLLRLGVNKLGDKDRNVASGVVQLLLRLEEAHPAMKGVIVEAISELIFRPGSDYHARYYGIITLNQTTLLTKDVTLTNKLMKVYLTLFERLLAEWNQKKPPAPQADEKPKKKPRWKNKGNKGKKGGERQEQKTSEAVREEEDSKMTNAILTGLVRAFPFSDLPKSTFDTHLDSLYRVTHSANFNTSLQALKLIHLISKNQSILSDRFYRTLYESLLDPRLAASNKHLKDYMNLVFRSLKEDGNQSRSKAFSKRIYQMATSWINIGVVSAVIYMLQEVSKTSPHLRELFAEEMKQASSEQAYDGKKRDPAFANAENTKLWEMIPLLNHYHPTVTVYAEGYLANDTSLVRPDLELHTLNHFLDRFVYKNPKQKTSTRGVSIMQPMAGGTNDGPVTTVDWVNKKLEDIDVSERFFYQYFTNRDKPVKPVDDGGELDEDEVWKALVDSHPDMEGEGANFDEEDMSDLDNLSMDEDDDEELDIDMDDISDLSDLDVDEGEQEEEDDEESEGQQEAPEDDDEFEGFDDDEDGGAEIDSDQEVEVPVSGKRKSSEDTKEPSKKRRLKDLPVYADASEYAHLLGDDDDDDIDDF